MAATSLVARSVVSMPRRHGTLQARITLGVIALTSLVCLAGCGNKGVSNAQDMIRAGRKLVRTLSTVKDPATAKAAGAEIDQEYQEFADALKVVIAYELEHGETRGRKKDIEEIEQDMAELTIDLQSELQRLKGMEELPAEFFAPIRRRSYEAARLSSEYVIERGKGEWKQANQLIEVDKLYQALPPEKIVDIKFVGTNESEQAVLLKRLRQRLPKDTKIVGFDNKMGFFFFVVGPATVEQVVAAIGFEEPKERYDSAGEILYEVDVHFEMQRAQLRDREEAERLAEEKRRAPPPPITVLPQEQEAAYEDAVRRVGQNNLLRYEFVNSPEFGDSNEARQVHTLLGEIGREPREQFAFRQFGWVASVDDFAAACAFIESFAEIVERDEVRRRLKLRVDPARVPAADSPGVRKLAGTWMPEPTEPDYLEQLSKLMWDEERRQVNHDAVAALMTVGDVELVDKEVRGRVARNFRTIAMDEELADEKAIEGLAHYGGRFSVPILIEILERPGDKLDSTIMDTLSRLGDPRGAEALVAKLWTEEDRTWTRLRLRSMGAKAEDAVLAATESDDPRRLTYTVMLLNDIGTKKSFPTLRRLVRNKDKDIAGVAQMALDSIVEREKERKKAGRE
jgi:hypothetical protein